MGNTVHQRCVQCDSNIRSGGFLRVGIFLVSGLGKRRGVECLGDELFRGLDGLTNTGCNKRLADDNRVSIFDVFGGEVSFDADGAVGLNLDVITQLRGGSCKVFYRHVGVDDSAGAGRNREDERGLLLSVIPPI